MSSSSGAWDSALAENALKESLFAIAISVNNIIKYKHKFKQWQAARKVKYHHSWPPMIIMNND